MYGYFIMLDTSEKCKDDGKEPIFVVQCYSYELEDYRGKCVSRMFKTGDEAEGAAEWLKALADPSKIEALLRWVKFNGE